MNTEDLDAKTAAAFDEVGDDIKKLEIRIATMEKDFAQMRLDLKAAGILHDEPYALPPVDELAEGPTKRVKSKKVKALEKKDPFA